MPFQPGSQKPAVAWTIRPRRPRHDLPSIRATMSSGSSTHSSVRAEAELAGVDHERLVLRRPRPPRSGSSAGCAGRSPTRGSCGTRGTCRRAGGRRSPAGPAPDPTGRSVIRPCVDQLEDRPVGEDRRGRLIRRKSGSGADRRGAATECSTLGAARRGPRSRGGAGRATRTRGRRAARGSPCGPRRGRRGNGAGARPRLLPPSSSPRDASSGSCLIAHQTMQISPISGIFSASINQTNPQVTSGR